MQFYQKTLSEIADLEKVTQSAPEGPAKQIGMRRVRYLKEIMARYAVIYDHFKHYRKRTVDLEMEKAKLMGQIFDLKQENAQLKRELEWNTNSESAKE